MPRPAPECDSHDEAVLVDIDELVEAHPHLLEHLHLIGDERDGSLLATPIPFREDVAAALEQKLGIDHLFDVFAAKARCRPWRRPR